MRISTILTAITVSALCVDSAWAEHHHGFHVPEIGGTGSLAALTAVAAYAAVIWERRRRRS